MSSIWTIWRRSLCAVSGAIAGGITGLLFGLAQLSSGKIAMTAAAETGIVLGFIAWIAILVVVGLWLHYGPRVIALPSLITSLVTAVLTVFIGNQLSIPILDVWIGLLVGTVVGAIFCRLCPTRQALSGGDDNGVR
jgi:hypothetical protein